MLFGTIHANHTTGEGFRFCACGLVAFRAKSPVKGGVSHNRLVDAVRSGSIVVASNMQSYQELGQIALLGTDHGVLINHLIPQYERLARKYEVLRPSLLSKFSPEINLNSWRQLLSKMMS